MLGGNGQEYRQEVQYIKNFSNQKNGTESDIENKQPGSPPSEDEACTTKVRQNPKYQLFLSSDTVGNGTRSANGPTRENGSVSYRWDSSLSRYGSNSFHGSMESLASRDWEGTSERVGGFDSPSRVFNSPYSSPSTDQMYRMPDYKDAMPPVASSFSLFSYSNSRSISPAPSITVPVPRARYSAYETLTRRREATPNAIFTQAAAPNKRDYIEELTRQLEESQKRNQFLEAESVEMDKERNQIRFEMRKLMVNNEDLFRTNAQLQAERKKIMEKMGELERENNLLNHQLTKQESELKEAREVMVEANTQEYAFSFLQQSLKNKIQDAEESLEKQTQHSQTLSEKLWHMERELEDLKIEKEVRDKKTVELSSTVLRLESELGEALKVSSQVAAEVGLHQKLKDESQFRVEELEESLLESAQELEKAQLIIRRLQGEVSEKLTDRGQMLEEEIQRRERFQLQCKQAERTIDDLQMELQAMAQTKDDLVKQLKQAQEKAIDLESEIEEMRENEQRLVIKQKRSADQAEQLQVKLMNQRDLNNQLDTEKVILEKEIKDLRMEVQELQNTKVQGDVVIKFESKIKDLENSLRAEERNKVMLTNTIGKLERKINELTDQMEEEQRLNVEQKDLMTQRIRSLKRQLNDVEEEASRKEAQHRHTQRELAEERETSARLQKQLLDQHLQIKRKESLKIKHSLETYKLDLSVDEEDRHGTDSVSNRDS